MVTIPIALDSVDALNVKLATLQANLTLITGEGNENFRELSEKLQDSYLYGCAQLVSECLAHIHTAGNGGTA